MQLPVDVFTYIAFKLPLGCIVALSEVDKTWYLLFQNQSLWQQLYNKTYGDWRNPIGKGAKKKNKETKTDNLEREIYTNLFL